MLNVFNAPVKFAFFMRMRMRMRMRVRMRMRMEDDSEDEDEDESEDEDVDEDETRRGSPVDRRPSSDEVPTIGKFHTFSKIAVTFGSIMRPCKHTHHP